jgi:2-keto-4-pentenoate hydratase
MMIMADGVVARLADNLWRAEIDRSPLSPITDVYPGLGIEAAYTVQSYNIERRVAAD